MRVGAAPRTAPLGALKRCSEADCSALLSPLARGTRCPRCRMRQRPRLRVCEGCGQSVMTRAHNFRLCGACRRDVQRIQSLAWKHRTRGVPKTPPKPPPACPDIDSSGEHDFAALDGLLICRYCSCTQGP